MIGPTYEMLFTLGSCATCYFVLFRAQARASSWAVRKQLGLDGGIRARTKQSEDQPGEPVLIFAGLIDILQVRIIGKCALFP